MYNTGLPGPGDHERVRFVLWERVSVFDSIAVVGATGAVGTLIRELLAERKFPYKKIKFLASARSAGKTLPFNGQEITVEELRPEAFDDIDLAIASTPDDVAAGIAFLAIFLIYFLYRTLLVAS